ncbi:MAG: hypothetical protein CR966_01330 [Pseudomonadales bacterium]|nr:MAG: hypothetical protein CR966_01330 [Pseudomonadales bacterium]
MKDRSFSRFLNRLKHINEQADKNSKQARCIYRLFAFAKFIWQCGKVFYYKQCSQMSASLTYTTLLSLVPILTLLLVVLSSIPVLEPVREQVYHHIYTNLMPESGLQLQQYLTAFTEQSSHLTTFGLGVLLYTAVSTLLKIELAFNHIWQVDIYKVYPKKSTVRNLLRNLAVFVFRHVLIIMVVPVVLGVAFLATGALKGLNLLGQIDIASFGISHIGSLDLSWLSAKIASLSDVGTLLWARLLSFVVTAIGFMAMYWFIPKAKVPIKNALLTGVIIAGLFELLHWQIYQLCHYLWGICRVACVDYLDKSIVEFDTARGGG